MPEKDPNKINSAYLQGVQERRRGCVPIPRDNVLDTLVGSDYTSDYKRGWNDADKLNQILGKGRWVNTNES